MLLTSADSVKQKTQTGEIPPRVSAVNQAMEDLHAKYPKSWALIDLLFFEEVSVDEIVEASDGRITKDHIRKDKHRALRRLKTILDNYPDSHDEDNLEGDG